MKLSIIIPHYAVGKMTVYTIARLLKYASCNDLQIIVVDNKASDRSHEYLHPFRGLITYIQYPEDKLQSHGIAIDYALRLGLIETEYFLCLENDAFPVDNFVDYYEDLINEGYDAAGSIMQLSGGRYMHPCGALYRKSVWQEANEYCKLLPYYYFPNIAMKEGFPTHLMVGGNIVNEFLKNPEDYIELSDRYRPYSIELAREKHNHYTPVQCVFHNGMGGLDESIRTYGNRNEASEVPAILCKHGKKIIKRMGYEPGQWFYYWMLANNKKVFAIPTKIKWMPGRENQQQEYSLTESNIHHIWGVSSYTERPAEGVEDIYAEKRGLPDQLYNTLPKHQRID